MQQKRENVAKERKCSKRKKMQQKRENVAKERPSLCISKKKTRATVHTDV